MPSKQITKTHAIIMRKISFLSKRRIREIETEFLDPEMPVLILMVGS
jgi:hypothetical protein